MGIIGDKLKEAGLLDNMRKAFRIEVRTWREAGGGESELHSVVKEIFAERKPDEGHDVVAQSRRHMNADVRSPMPEGQRARVREDHAPPADGLPIAGGEAKFALPEKAVPSLPPARGTVSPIRDEGQLPNVCKDQDSFADVPNQLPREGQLTIAPKGQGEDANAGNPIASGKASAGLPEKAILPLPPAREPSVVGIGHNSRTPNKPRSLAELQRTRAIVKPSVFETCSLRGEPLARMTRGRLKKLRFENLFEASLGTLILNYAAADDNMLIPDIIKGEQLSKMILEAQEIANAA